MNTDSYTSLLSEEKMDLAARQALSGYKNDPDHSISYHISTAMHELFCPCILQSCPACASKCGRSVIECSLMDEITSRIHRMDVNGENQNSDCHH